MFNICATKALLSSEKEAKLTDLEAWNAQTHTVLDRCQPIASPSWILLMSGCSLIWLDRRRNSGSEITMEWQKNCHVVAKSYSTPSTRRILMLDPRILLIILLPVLFLSTLLQPQPHLQNSKPVGYPRILPIKCQVRRSRHRSGNVIFEKLPFTLQTRSRCLTSWASLLQTSPQGNCHYNPPCAHLIVHKSSRSGLPLSKNELGATLAF